MLLLPTIPRSPGSSPQWIRRVKEKRVERDCRKSRLSAESDLQRRNVTIVAARYRISQGLLLLLAICFGLQIFSPLRLNTDAIVLLSVADSAAHGNGFLDDGQKTVFPPGYPALLAVLLRVGLGHSWVIISLNAVLLAVGVFATYRLLIREFFADKVVVLALCSLSLLSYVVVKHFAIPLTDVPFFCFAMCCLAMISHAKKMSSNRGFVILTVAACLFALAAITLRRIGVALVPSLIFMIVCSSQLRSLLVYLRRTKEIVALVFAILSISIVGIVSKTSTLSDFVAATNKSSTVAVFLEIWNFRLTEFGELFINIPMSKLPANLHFLVPFIGIVLLLLTLGGLAAKRQDLGSTEVFFIAYAGILFAWPFYDARFWLPVIPLLLAYSALSVTRIKLSKAIVMIYCSGFVLFGFMAIAYSTRISLSGHNFPDRYGDGVLRPTYCEAFQSCGDNDSKNVNRKALRLLREFS